MSEADSETVNLNQMFRRLTEIASAQNLKPSEIPFRVRDFISVFLSEKARDDHMQRELTKLQ